MSHFTPAKIISTFTTKDNQSAIIRYPKWEDIDVCLDYINTLSAEDTFITFSGEKFTHEQEVKAFSGFFQGIENQHRVLLFCFIGDQLAGICHINRKLSSKKRSLHVGVLGISVAQNFRNLGIASQSIQTTMAEAKKHIDGLKLVYLSVYSANQPAIKLYQKLGFSQCGVLPEAILYRGQYLDKITMYQKL